MKKTKKFISMLLTAIIILSMLAVPTLAAEIQGAEKFPDVKKTEMKCKSGYFLLANLMSINSVGAFNLYSERRNILCI